RGWSRSDLLTVHNSILHWVRAMRMPLNMCILFTPPLMTRIRQQSGRQGQSILWASTSAIQAAGADLTEEEASSVGLLKHLLDGVKGEAVVLTGAGISTDSGIPDYRGPNGSYSRGHKPMMHDEFIRSEKNRKRYWARSVFGWNSFANARPNNAHYALANLESQGRIKGVITQNVDSLHQMAGSSEVLHLHGRNDKVKCLSCGFKSSRHQHQDSIARLNAHWVAANSPSLHHAPMMDSRSSSPCPTSPSSSSGASLRQLWGRGRGRA
ncbi:unnamed protein product, partial [Discosporangium mesarthrocarpum]